MAQIPSDLSFAQASTVPLGLATAAIGLYHPDPSGSASLAPPWETSGRGKYAGQPFVVFGGSSSVGQYGTHLPLAPVPSHKATPLTAHPPALQLAKLSGFSPVIATASARNTEYVLSLGATHVVDRTLAPAALVAEITRLAGAPIPVVYDAISEGGTQEAAYSVLAPGGTLVIVLDATVPKDAGKLVKHVYGNVNPPNNLKFGAGLYAQLTALLERGDIKVRGG